LNKDAFKKLILILILFTVSTLLKVNFWYQERLLDIIEKQISSKQDEIRSLNIILSNQKNDYIVMLEAQKLQFRKIQFGESVIIDDEPDT